MTDHAHAADPHGSPGPAEPRTPMWLPALGGVLFLLVAIWWGLSSAREPAPAPAAGGEAAGGGAAAAPADAGAGAAPAAAAAPAQ